MRLSIYLLTGLANTLFSFALAYYLTMMAQVADKPVPDRKVWSNTQKSTTFLNNKAPSALRSPGRIFLRKMDWRKKKEHHTTKWLKNNIIESLGNKRGRERVMLHVNRHVFHFSFIFCLPGCHTWSKTPYNYIVIILVSM